MRSVLRLATLAVVFAALGVLALRARAQDPPPGKARHQNVVTPEAKAAIDRFNRLVYVADRHGLRSCSGVLVPVGFASDERSPFEWKPPGLADLRLSGPVARELSAARLWTWAFRIPIYLGLHPDGIFDYAEFDARIAHERDGLTTLAVTEYDQGSVLSSDEFVFDREGLLTKRVHGVPRGSTSQAYSATYTYAKVGDAYCLAGMQFTAAKPSAARYVCTLRYAEVAGVHLLVSYDVAVLTEAAVRRKFTFHVADLAVNGESVELPTPWKHVNKVTPEAQAAIDRYSRLVYRPTDHGLRSAAGTFLPAGIRFEVRPEGLDVRPPAGDSGGTWDATIETLRAQLPFAYGGVLLTAGPHYDAAIVEKFGRPVLAVTNYVQGAVVSRCEFVLDERGLVTALSTTGADPASETSEMRLGWASVGDKWQVERIESWLSREPERVTVVFAFANTAGGRVPVSVKWVVTNVPGVVRIPVFAATDLTVNGAKVDLPAVRLHDNDVTSEAQAWMDAYERRHRRMCGEGVVTASGKLVPVGAPAEAQRFSFSAPLLVSVTLPASVKPDSPDGKLAIGSTRFAIISALDGVRLNESFEYDARLVDRGTGRLLEVVAYEADRRTATLEYSFDAEGRVASMRRRDETGLDGPRSDFTTRFEWETAGEVLRLRAVEVSAGDFRKRFEYTYLTTDGLVFIASISVRAEQGGESTRVHYRVEDLVLNGKRVALPKPDAQPAGGGK